MQNTMDELSSNLSIPFSLKDALSLKTKDELHTLRREYGIKNASSLNKGLLVDLLSEEIPRRLENLFFTWDDHRIHVLNDLVFKGGQVFADRLESQQISFFLATGFIFLVSGEENEKLVLPSDPALIERLQAHLTDTKWPPIIKQNTEWIKIVHGMLFYYGSLSDDQFYEIVEGQFVEPKEFRRFIYTIREARFYYESHYQDEDGFSFYDVMEPREILEQQEMRPTLDFYPFTKKEFIRAGEEGYVERTPSYKKVAALLMKECSLSKKEADLWTEECQSMFKQGYIPNEVVKILSENIEFKTMESAKKVIDELMTFYNNTKQWFLKGYAPSEIKPRKHTETPTRNNNVINFESGQKVGRNDPCPCGSGKKFKKCCGN